MPTRKKSPEPIEFPKPPKGINLMTPDEFLHSRATEDEEEDIPHPEPETGRLVPFPTMMRTPISIELKQFIRTEIRKAFDEYSSNLYHTLEMPEAEIVVMSEAEFQALMRVVLEDDTE